MGSSNRVLLLEADEVLDFEEDIEGMSNVPRRSPSEEQEQQQKLQQQQLDEVKRPVSQRFSYHHQRSLV